MAPNRLSVPNFINNTLLMLTGLVLLHRGKAENVAVNVFTEDIVRETSEKFVSITLGSSRSGDGWRNIKDSLKVGSLASALSPAYLRIGGTFQDELYWDKDGKGDDCYNASQIERLYNFAQATKLDLIFGLPVLTRKDDGSWDPTKSAQMFVYIIEKGFTNFGWELGNEPDRLFTKFNITISAEQLVKDVQRLKDVLTKYRLNNTKIYGPDVAALHSDHDSYDRYLKAIPNGLLEAVTWHQYYKNSLGSRLYDFINVTLLDRFISYCEEAVNIAYNHLGQKTAVWLGETSSTYNGGAPGLSDTYIAGFMWLDKLGITALANHSVVCRQSFYGGHYSLLDSKTMDPLPDYWSSVLYKRLVGTKVLMVENSLHIGRMARVYAHCTRISKYYDYEAGAVTLIVLNLHQNKIIDIQLKGKLGMVNIDQFLLQPGTESITSKKARLNGKMLNLLEDYQLPELVGTQVEQPFAVPSLNYGFFVIPQAKAKACLTNNNLA